MKQLNNATNKDLMKQEPLLLLLFLMDLHYFPFKVQLEIDNFNMLFLQFALLNLLNNKLIKVYLLLKINTENLGFIKCELH